MTRDDLSPELGEKYDKLIEEFEKKKKKIPEYKGPSFNCALARKPYKELEDKYYPLIEAIIEEAKKKINISGEGDS